MPIIDKYTSEDGISVGWDTDRGEWIELDTAAEEGTTLGNIGRAAGRSVEDIGLGLGLYGSGEAAQLQEQMLRERQQAASRSAPIASAVGEVVPDVTAGLAMAPLTGGMSMPAMLGTELLAGSVLGGIRPGSIDERIGRAAVGGLASVGGAALAPAAAAGVGSALRLFRNIEGETLSRIGREADQASVTLREASQPAGRSVGAAETPEELLGRTGTEAEEQAVYQATEQAGAEATSPGFEQKLLRAQQLGHTPTIGQATRGFSPARLYQAGREFLPGGDAAEATVRANNQSVLARHAAKAVGDPKWENVQRIDPSFFHDQELRIGEAFKDVERRMPALDEQEYAKTLRTIRQESGAFGSLSGQKKVERAIENLENRIGPLTGEQVMQDRKKLSTLMSRFYRNGDTDEGDVLYQALGKLDDLIAKEINKNKYKVGLAEKWASARQQWQILKMLESPGSTSGSGDVNPISLMSKLRRDRSKGGFGPGGPADTESAASELFDLAEVNADSLSGVPMTGMRLMLRQGARLGTGAAGIGLGTAGASSLWD